MKEGRNALSFLSESQLYVVIDEYKQKIEYRINEYMSELYGKRL